MSQTNGAIDESVIEGTVAREIATTAAGTEIRVSVEHPAGEFSVELGLDPGNPQHPRSGVPASPRCGSF